MQPCHRMFTGPARMDDPFNLVRFVEAQARFYDAALAELRAGKKTGHWMWFVFPQVAGLGRSSVSQRFAISSLDEVRAYLEDPVLGPRLRTCVEAINGVSGKSAREIFGQPDDMKFRSSLTLFSQVAPEPSVFTEALQKYFNGHPDPLTIELLRSV
jgi:uncharacterized protein (DUF1810 family)